MYNNSIMSLQKRLLAVFLLIISIFFALIIRLFVIQIVKSDWLTAKASSQWLRDLPINAKRGDIVDVNGSTLAESFSSYDVYVRASMVTEPVKVSNLLSSVIGLDYEETFKKVTNTTVSESLIKLQLDDKSAKKIIDANYKGVLLSENNKRYYPYGDLLTQVLGFTTIDNSGQAGIELYADKYLQGTKGYALEESDVNGRKIDNTLSKYIPSIAGCNVQLTIDVNIQQIVEQALLTLCEEQKPKTATAIVMNPNTGEIVAMSSKPSFDLNNPPRDNVSELLNNVKNLSIVDVYEPGSTFKVLTTATALEEKVTNPNEGFYDPGYRIVDGEKIKCWKLIGHGQQTMTDGLCNSCNSVFVDLALRLGTEKMYSYFKKYGFGDTLGVDFLGEAQGILMNKEKVKTVDLARMGFGQAVAVSPIQLITAICSVVNGGKLYKPYFINQITDVNGKLVTQNTSTVLNRTVSENTSATIRSMLERVVTKSNAIEAFIPGHRVSGKTGTSQKYEGGRIVQKYVSSFVGAYPADNPDYVVLVIADEPSMGNYFGSVVATPYAKLIFKGIIDYKQYKPTEDVNADEKLLEKNIKMPNLLGLSLTDAVSKIVSLGLQYEIAGEGDVVVSQTPPPDTFVYKNSVVIINT